MIGVVMTTGTINRRAKLQSNHHHQQTNIQFSTGRMPFLSPNQQCHSADQCFVMFNLDEAKLIEIAELLVVIFRSKLFT